MTNPIRVEILGMGRVQDAIRAFGEDVAKGLVDSLNSVGLEAISEVRKAIQGPPKTGRVYKRGKKEHRASAPGEAPATDGGRLASSVYFSDVGLVRRFSKTGEQYTVAMGSSLAYAFYLEFGTREIAKRPVWLPAAERAAPRLQRRIEKVIRAAKAKAEGRTS